MHSLPQLMLLHGNGYKAVAARDDDRETRLLVADIKGKGSIQNRSNNPTILTCPQCRSITLKPARFSMLLLD